MAGSFGILLFVLFVGASNLALGYAAAVYFGKARLEIVWLTWQLPLTWFFRQDQPAEPVERLEVGQTASVPSPTPLCDALPATNPVPDPMVSNPSRKVIRAEQTPSRPTRTHRTEETELEASLAAYSLAANRTAGDESFEEESRFANEELAPEAWAISPSEEEGSADASLSTLLDDLVAQNLSELEDAFAQIEHYEPVAEAANDAREAVAAY